MVVDKPMAAAQPEAGNEKATRQRGIKAKMRKPSTLGLSRKPGIKKTRQRIKKLNNSTGYS
jgi:hypothetical protein